MRYRAPVALVSLLALAALGSAPPSASAAGWVLDGRMAPDLTFTAGGLNGIGPGTSLSQFRGKVVWLKFWLRDCPICRRTMPDLQAAQARWGKQGLVTVTVLHGFGPADPVLNDYMRQNGFTFGVGSDLDGRLASQYGVHVRPTDYLISIDGRVSASNGVPETVLLRELGRYRLAKFDPAPESMRSTVRDAIWRNEMAKAYRDALAAAGAADAAAEAKEALRKVQVLAEEDVAARAGWASWLTGQRRSAEAKQALDLLASDYRGTPLEARASPPR